MTKEEWLKKYKQYFLDHGCDEKVAQDATDAADCAYIDLFSGIGGFALAVDEVATADDNHTKRIRND